MQWKVLFVVILVLGIFGFFLTSEFGRPYADLLGQKISGFTGSFIKPGKKPSFVFSIETDRLSIYGLTPTRISNSTFTASGPYNFLRVGDQTINLKNKNQISLYIKNLRGTFSISTDGVAKISGYSNYVETEEIIFSSSSDKKIEIEMMPISFTLSNFATSDFVMPSISGTIKRFVGDTPDTISFQKSKIEIKDFTGSLEWRGQNTLIDGVASSIKGDKFSFN